MMKAFRAMLDTELKLSLRGMDMLIFALCMPVVIMVILGILYGSKPAFPGAEYTFVAQSFGAVAAIAICAGGVMGLPLVVADYRQKRILKRLQVTPTSPALILVVQTVVYAIYAAVSLLLVYGTAHIFFQYRLEGSWIRFAGAYLLVMLSMFSIGMLVGGTARDMKTAGIFASVLYFPMLIFSGATLPYEVMPAALQRIADLMPLTQGIKLLKAASLGYPSGDVWISVTVLCGVAVLCSLFALRFFKWE
ncbi:MAG: ABC transporter permease [Desulfobacterales bacterium]|jgi:ABC-2 type transport system permease protein|nr:ABC transporter permease [Desulfobacterales bacterium]